MNIKDLKVSDKVYIREDLKRDCGYGGYIYYSYMPTGVATVAWVNDTCTRFKINNESSSYSLEMVDWRKTFRLRVKEEFGEAHSEQEQEQEQDRVNSPLHYKLDGLDIESVDVIRSVLGKEKFIGWVWGNGLKYLLRQEKKNGLEDIKKAMKNLEWLVDALEEGKNEH